MNLKHTLLAVFTLAFLFLTAMAVHSFFGKKHLAELHRQEEHSTQLIHELLSLEVKLKHAESATRAYLLTGEENYIDPLDTALDELKIHLNYIRQLTANGHFPESRIDSLFSLVHRHHRRLADAIDRKKYGGMEAVLPLIGPANEDMESIRQKISEMMTAEAKLLKERNRKEHLLSKQIIYFDVISSSIAVIFLVFAIFKLHLDIKRREDLERSLRDSEERYRLLFEEDLTGDYIATPEGNLLMCNPAFAHIFGFESPEQVMGETIEKLYPDIEIRKDFLENLRKQGKLVSYELSMQQIDGNPIHVVENAIGQFDEAGNLLEIKGYIYDNTARKKAEIDREKLILQLKDALARVKTLSGLVPICSSCKKIRDDQGYWQQVEVYVKEHSNAEFTHGVCPECAEKLYGEYLEKMSGGRDRNAEHKLDEKAQKIS